MAQVQIPLSNIPTSWYMSWFITTQAAYRACVTLADSERKYIDNVCKQSTNIDPPLSQGFEQVSGTGLLLTITVDQSAKLQVVNQPYTIADPRGNVVGYGYTICIEDSTDEDFNDVYVSIAAWRQKG